MSQRKSAFARRAQFGFESLEARSLLSGLHAGAATQAKLDDHRGAIVSTGGAAAVAKPAVSSKLAGSSQQSQQSEVHLGAALADPTGASTTTGSVRYESETEHGVVVSEFCVSVKGATPGAVIDVSIADASGNSVVVGQITAAADGTGKLSFATNPHGSSQAFPANFPALTAGSTVSLNVTDSSTGVVTTLATGTLAASAGHSEDSEDDSDDANETHLSAALADPNSTLTGSAKYESESEHGVVVSEFTVSVKGGKAGAVIDVSIADASGKGVSVGQITLGANGTGKLSLASNPHDKSQKAFPANFPAVAEGSIVTLSAVDTTSGATTPITSAALAVSTIKKSR